MDEYGSHGGEQLVARVRLIRLTCYRYKLAWRGNEGKYQERQVSRKESRQTTKRNNSRYLQ